MPVPSNYIDNAYNALKDNLSGFDKTPEQFKSLITSDPTYRSKVYTALKDNLSGFDKTPETFDSLVVGSQKKNSISTNLSVGSNGQLQQSNPAISQSKSQKNNYNINQSVPEFQAQKVAPNPNTIDNNFNLPSVNDLAKNQQSVSDNTTSASNTKQIDTDNIGFEKSAQRKVKENVAKIKDQAIDNTTQRSLKQKGIDAQPGSLLYNIERAKYAGQVNNGDATVSQDKDGNVGLKRTTDWIESAKIGWDKATQGNKDAENFVNHMTPAEQVNFLKQQQAKQDEYIGTRPSNLGSLTGTVAEQAPFMGKAAAGYVAGLGLQALAPETGGLSELALPKIFSFLATSKDAANQSAMQEIISRSQILKHQHPDWTDEQAMEEANKGKLLGAVQGLATNYLFNETGANPIAGEARNTLTNSIKGLLKSSAEGATKATAVNVTKDLIDKAQGVGKSSGQIINDAANSWVDNAGTIGLLHAVTGAVTGAFKLPKVVLSAAKNALSKESTEAIGNTLEMNVKAGNISHEDATKVANDIAEFKNNLTKIPDSAPDNVKSSIAGLIQKRTDIENEAQIKDVTAQPVYKQQIDAINNQISEIQRTGKPLEHEIDESTGKPYEQPTYDKVAASKINDIADRISKGKDISEPENLQAEQNFPEQLKDKLNDILKEEKSANKDKETPNTEITDNIKNYLDANKKTIIPNTETQAGTSNEGTHKNIEGTKEATGTIRSEQNSEVTGTTSLQEKSDVVNTSDNAETATPAKNTNISNDNESKREHIMNMLVDMKDSGFDYRITSDISQKDREKGVEDLRNGKDSAAARKVKGLVDDIVSKGELPMHRGRGGMIEKFNIPFEHWFGLEPHEREAAENLDDNTTSIINDEGITKNNIDNFKHLFNESGFPYTTEDFNNIKAHLSRQDESNVDNQTNGEQSQPNQSQSQLKTENNASTQSSEQQQESNEQSSKSEHARTESSGSEETSAQATGSNSNQRSEAEKEKVNAGDDDTTSIKNEYTRAKREELGLDKEVPTAKKEFGTTWEEAKDKIEKGYNVQDLIDELKKKPRPLTDVENAMLLHHQNTKEIQLIDTNKFINEAAEKNNESDVAEGKVRKARLLDELQDIYDVDKAVGTENARGLSSRKMMIDRRYSLTNMIAEKRASANDGKPLSEEQTAEIEKLHAKIHETQKAFDDYVKEAESEIKDLQEKILGKKVADKKTAAQKLRELADKVEKSDFLKAKLPEGTQISGAGVDIYKLTAQAMRAVATGLEKGGELLDLIKKAVEDIKKDNPDIDENLLRKSINKQVIDSGINSNKIDRDKTKEYAGLLDVKALKLRAASERAKNEYDISLKKDEAGKRNKWQKLQDTFIKWQRAFKLSNPVTIGKLTAAALTRGITTPLEDVVGGAVSTIAPKFTKSAIGEGGGLNIKETAKAYANGFKEGVNDAAKILSKKSHGKSDIDTVFGKSGQLPPEAIDFFGQLHSATKAPIKRIIFDRQLQKRFQRSIKAGLDVSDPMVQSEIAIGAYKDANRAIFMQDNKVSEGWQKMVNYFERIDPKTGKANAKGVATALQWLVPFVKVPTNIASEIGTNVYGVPVGIGKIIYSSFTKGLENLSSDEKDIILRNLKKGSLGLAALSLGYFNPQVFGGYYQEGEKRNKEDAKANAIKLFGTNIPAWLIESPVFQAMQIGATVRRVKDERIKGQENGIGEGIWAGALGMADKVPLIDQPVRIAKAFTKPKERQYFLGELAKSTLIPAVIQKTAELTDPAEKRNPSTIMEHIESGIPGIREKVPEKNGKSGSGGGGGATGNYRQRRLSLRVK